MAHVIITKQTQKAVAKLPREIQESLATWIDRIYFLGLQETRKIKGYHDEPLKGSRKGQRSVRLNRAYRAIYTFHQNGEIELVTIIEVHKHKY